VPAPHELGSRPKDASEDIPDGYTINAEELDLIHHRGEGLALGTFALCKTENVLCKAGLPTLTEMRDENTMKTGIRIMTNENHPTSLRRLCNETRITKTLLHNSGRISRIDGRKEEKTSDYTNDGKSICIDLSVKKMDTKQNIPRRIPRTGKLKIQRPHKDLHRRVKEGRKSKIRGREPIINKHKEG
jgi:hypothetical protein